MIADIRGWLARRSGDKTITSKPYDVAGALLCAQAAGCVVSAPFGEPLDFPIDCVTALDFVGFANAATARRIAPHLDAALRSGPSVR
jgi:fructose-1,6-bisphosphatase/inositol monophosphatase family enzyme